MALLIQKFGGSSVATAKRLRAVADRIARARRRGDEVVVVTSAMGDTTDRLLGLAADIAPDAGSRHPRELDMLLTAGERVAMALLAMAVRETGIEAVSFTGSQAAIITDDAHTGARIQEVRATRVRDELARGRVVIVAGFQGVSHKREVTTLGRGGSDTTAVALSVALAAARCEVYTDVAGIFTADPRLVPGAAPIRRIGFEAMLELAQSGARVLHLRAVELAARYGVTLRVASADDEREDGGTMIMANEAGMESPAVTGLASERDYARLRITGMPAGTRVTAVVLSRLADADVSLDMVTPLDRPDGRRDLQLSLRGAELERARDIAHALVRELDGEEVRVDHTELARIALVGSGMHGRPGVYARALDALVERDIEVYGFSTSSVSITLLVAGDRERPALNALHDAFGLAREAG